MSERSESVLRKNMRLSIVEGIVAMPLVFLTMPGNFLLANLATGPLNLSSSIYGIIASLPAWSNVAQLFAMPFLTRFFPQKSVCLAFSYFHAAAWLILGLALPYLPQDGSWPTIAIMIGVLAVISFGFSIINISWTSWIEEWLPKKSRGRYLGRRNRTMQISTVVFLIVAGKTISLIGDDNPLLGFQIIIFIGVFLRFFSIRWQHHIYSLRDGSQETTSKFTDQIGTILKNKPLIRLILFGVAFNFTANFIGPFFTIFLHKALELGLDEIGYLVTIATVTGALAMSAWGDLFDKYGCRPVMAIALICWMLNGYFFTFATPDRTWVAYAIFFVGGIFGAGFIFGSFNMILKLVPPNAKTTAISLNLALGSLAGAISPIIGGIAIEWAEARYPILDVFHLFSAIHHTAILLTVLILLTVQEPKSSSLLQAAGAMRSFRQAGAFLGMSFLMNYSFFKKKRITKDNNSTS